MNNFNLGQYIYKIRDYLFAKDNVLETPLIHFYGVCERKVQNDIYAEPLNVITGIGFFIAAFMVYLHCKNHPEVRNERKIDIYIMIFLICLIGVASITFHMVPSKYTELFDIVTIVTFIHVFFYSFVVRVAGLKLFNITIVYLAFLGSTHMLVSQFPNAMNDSVAYLSSVVAIIFMAFYMRRKRRSAAGSYFVASIIGMVSLFFRSIDNFVCDQIPFGTHFIWHILNAFLIFILMKQLVRSINRRARMLRMAAEAGA